MGIKVDLKKQYNDTAHSGKKSVKKSFTLDVSFKMENELVVLFGPSGSGKTTLFKCISGITDLDKGKITVENKVYFDKDQKTIFIFGENLDKIYSLMNHPLANIEYKTIIEKLKKINDIKFYYIYT